MARKVVALALAVILIAAVAGLAIYYYDAYHRLTFELDGISLGNTSLTAVQTNFAIDIGNPSVLPIHVPNGDFKVYINDQYLGNGSFASVTLPGNSETQITVPVIFNPADVPSILYGLIIAGGNVTVRIEGTAHLILLSVPFNATLYDATIG